MRNVAGLLSQQKINKAILSCLATANIDSRVLLGKNKRWKDNPPNNSNIQESIQGISWKHNGQNRCLFNNIKVPIVGTNVDICVFNSIPSDIDKNNCNHYLALGELKGGIDPAGADEHWKTANSALERIQKAFEQQNCAPAIFFIGAAIEKRMAEEIWNKLTSGTLTNAANLNNDIQTVSICKWICFSLF